nr:serine hydrolase [Clostridia bacterium]
KGGTLNRTKVYNSAVIAEIPDSDELLACVIMGANEPNNMPDNRFKAARQALDMAMAKLSDESAVIDESTICARSAVVCHVKGRDISGVHTLVSKSPEEMIGPASISKLLTTMLALENAVDLTAEITVTEEDLALLPSAFYQKDFRPGDIVSLDDAIFAMLLPSSNLAAYFIARYIGQLMSENK